METGSLQHIPAFISYLEFEKRYSGHTLRSYHDDLQQFNEFMRKEYDGIPDTDIKPALIRSWLVSLKKQEMTAKTLNRKLSSLRSYYRFLLRKKHIGHNPLLQVTAPKISRRLPVFVEQQDMETLLKNVEFTNDRQGRMHHLILLFFYHTGTRLSELINIKTADVDDKRFSLKVLGKGNKERIIPLTPALATAIKKYLEDYPSGSPFLFHKDDGKKLYPAYVYKLVKNELGRVTTIKKKSPHVLRHSFATHLSNNGAELNAIKELLGHASLAATQVYTHNSIEKLKEIHAKAHPKS